MDLQKINLFRNEFMGVHYRPLTEEDLAEKQAQPNAQLVMVRKGDQLVGVAFTYIIDTLTRKALVFDEFIVDREFRGQGYGKQLMQRIEELARAERADCVECTVKNDNPKARHFYTRLGFKNRENQTLRLWLK